MSVLNAQWGSVANSNAKLGLAIEMTQHTASQVKITVEVWLNTAKATSDTGNSFVFTHTNDAGTGNSTKTASNFNISTSAGTNKLLTTYTLTYSRWTANRTITLKADLKEIGNANYTVTVSKTIELAGKPSFSISYNGNGGTTPSATTGTYGTNKNMTLASTSRTGHTFKGWYADLSGSKYINMGREYMYAYNFSAHVEAYMSNWTMDSGEHCLISCTEGAGWSLYKAANSNVIQAIAYDAGTGYKYATSSINWSSLSAGWHSFDVIFDGSYLYLYVDEAKVATSPKFSSGLVYYNNTNAIFVGAEPGSSSSAPTGGYFNCRVRNVIINNDSTRVTNANAANKFTAPMSNVTMIAEWAVNKYYLDVNGLLDGVGGGNISGYGTVDVYVNGSQVANDVTDFYNQYDYGSTYEIKDIKASSGKTYYGVNGGSLTGTIGADKVTTTLDFRTLYTVSYDANGGSGAPGNQNKIYGVNLTLSSTKPTKASTTSSCTITINANSGSSTVTSRTSNRTTTYSFSSWNTNSGGTGTSYAAGATYTGNAALALYAIYTSSTGSYGAVTLPTTSECTRSGYDLLGFSTSSTATTATYSPGASYTPTGNVTLYAVWKLKTYTITYNGNGNIVSGTPSNQTKTHGTALTLSSTSPTRTRYKFLGWSTSSSATSATYAPGASFTTNANTTLYAVWQLQDKTIWIYNTGKIDAVDFVTVSTFSELFDTNGKVYGKGFVTHSESNVYIGTDGKIYAKEFIKY